jgi:hypothetical protein
LDSFLPSFSTLVNKTGLDKFLDYSLNSIAPSSSSSNFFKNAFYDHQVSNLNSEEALNINGDQLLKVNNILNYDTLNSNLFFSK